MWENLSRAELEAVATLYRAALQCSPYEMYPDELLRKVVEDYSKRLRKQNAERLEREQREREAAQVAFL